MKKAVILLSGGLDSATCLALAKSQGFACYALTINYGQRHHAELEASKRVANFFNVQHKIVDIPSLQTFGGSALTDTNIAVPDYSGDGKIPVTYVPARNTIFLSIALGLAEAVEAYDIFIGSSVVDYSGYPDCRPEYFAAFQKMANLATKAAVEGRKCSICAPLVHLSKAETIRLGLELGMDYSLTVSCYSADDTGHACGKCDSCFLRKKGFKEAGVVDPTLYSPLSS